VVGQIFSFLGKTRLFFITIFWTTWFPVLELPKYSELFVVCSRKEKEMLYKLLRMLPSLSLCSRRNMWGFLNLKEIFLWEDGGWFAIIADYSYPIIDYWQLVEYYPKVPDSSHALSKESSKGPTRSTDRGLIFQWFLERRGPKRVEHHPQHFSTCRL